MNNQNQRKMRVVESLKTPQRNKNNYQRETNTDLGLKLINFRQKETNRSPIINYQSKNNNINNENSKMQKYIYQNNFQEFYNYSLKSKNSDINEIYFVENNKNTIPINIRYPTNYSFYESKYTTKITKPQNSEQFSNYNINSNTHNVKYYMNQKTNLNDNQIQNSLIQNLNRSHMIFPQYSTKKNINNEYIIATPTKTFSEILYSKVNKNNDNYSKNSETIKYKRNQNEIIYSEHFSNYKASNIPKQPKTPTIYAQSKVEKNKSSSYTNKREFSKNENNSMSNLNSKNSKSLKDINFGKTIVDVKQNNKNINNNSQNNLTKMVKYMNQTITNQKREPFRLIDEVKNNKYNNNINNTIVNITYINENKNYIKNVYNNDLLKPESKDKINIDSDKTEIKPNINQTNKSKNIYIKKGRTPNQYIKIINVKNKKANSPTIDKHQNVNVNHEINETKSNLDNKKNNKNKVNNNQKKIVNKKESDYMEEISNIMYNNNSRQIYEYNHNTLRQKISPSTNNHTIINDINVAQQQKNEKNKNNNTSRTNRKKTKGVERNYELSYNAKIIDSKYRKKSHEYLYNTIDKKFNTSNKNTNLSIDFYSKTAKKTDAFRENKPFINSLSKSNELNNKPSIITQEKVIKRVDIPSSISKFTIEANSKKPKTAKNKKNEEKKPINENTKINPFKIDEEKSSRKKTFDVNKIIIKKEIKQEKEKEKENIISIKKCEGISIAGRNEKGMKKTNQDTFFIERNVNGVDNFNIYGVLDGHGENGHFASDFVKKYIINNLKNHPLIKYEKDHNKLYSKLKSDGYKIIANIYLDADIEIQNQDFDPSRSGTTCIIIIQILEHIICANTGDSRGMIVFDKDDNLFKSKVYPLSYDCKPELPNEKMRIIESGGIVEKAYYSDDEDGEYSGPYRVWEIGKDYPGLAMSRSIGDMDAKKVGVIPNPQIVEYIIDKTTKYFILASDGVWEFIDNEECMKFCNSYFLKNDCIGLCKDLSQKATNLWNLNDVIVDDITIVAGFF